MDNEWMNAMKWNVATNQRRDGSRCLEYHFWNSLYLWEPEDIKI